MVLKGLLGVSLALIGASALGFLFAPDQMLAVVGMDGTPALAFLARAGGAGLAAIVPGIWAALRHPTSPTGRAVILGVALYLVLTSVIDLFAFQQGIVNVNSLPSIVIRTAMGVGIGLCLRATWAA